MEKDDLIQEILVRLPVVSLLRFKSVCKSWCTLIESSFFIHLHTTSNNNNSKFGSFILLASADKFSRTREHSLIMLSSESESDSEEYESEPGGDWPWISRDDGQLDNLGLSKAFKVELDAADLLGKGSNDQLVLKLESLGVPKEYESCYIFKQIIGGSCNGLVCIYDEHVNNVSLWNPATRKHRILPKPIKIVEEGELSPRRFAVGFGFDGEDYKVVLLTGFRAMFYRPGAQPECPCKVQVYSLSTDSWSLINQGMMICLPGDPFAYPGEGLYLNGRFYFMANFLFSEDPFELEFLPDKNNRLIVSFDFTDYTFNAIGIPEHERNHWFYLSCLGDKIALFRQCPTPEFDDSNIWVLEEHGGGGMNWEKLYSFKVQRMSPGERNFPIGISNDGEFALLKTGNEITGFCKKIKLYHFATEQVKMNFLSCSALMYKANAYKPSLVSIMSGKTNFLSCSALMYKANAYKPTLVSIMSGKTAEAAADFLQGFDLGTN